MMNTEYQDPKQSSTEDDPRVDLAIERTMLAMERTLLAWVRTVLGLITGGVAIDKGTAAIHDARIAAGVALMKNGHLAGLFLTIVGTSLMIVVTVAYVKRIRELKQMVGLKRKFPEPGTMLAIFICILGGLAIYFLST
jgi:putative membrane protein